MTVEYRYMIWLKGCLCCGTPSYVVDVAETLEEAQKIADEKYVDTWDLYGGDGQTIIIDMQEELNGLVLKKKTRKKEKETK